MALDANGHPVSRISQRKLEHLKLSLEASVQSTRTAGFDRFCFTHQALPELDLDAIDTSTTFLNKPLKLPFLISSMTGGAHAAGDINRRLALVAQSVGIAFGVSSLPPAWPRSTSPAWAAPASRASRPSAASAPRRSSSRSPFPSGASRPVRR